MKNKITAYVETAFRDAPKNERSENVKKEILQNLLDKYDDLIAEGRGEEEAYAVTVSGAGDLSGIVEDLKCRESSPLDAFEKARADEAKAKEQKRLKKERKKFNRFTSWYWPLVVCVYLIGSFLFRAWAYSWILFLLAAAGADAAKYVIRKSDEKARRNALNGMVWLGITSLYFIVSFATGRWGITWLIFVLGIAVENLVRALTNPDDDEDDDDEEDGK